MQATPVRIPRKRAVLFSQVTSRDSVTCLVDAQHLRTALEPLTTTENTITYHDALCLSPQILHKHCRGGEWYLEKRGSRKILAGSRNLGSVFDKSRFCMVCFYFF